MEVSELLLQAFATLRRFHLIGAVCAAVVVHISLEHQLALGGLSADFLIIS